MKTINIADEKQRNARVAMDHKRAAVRMRYLDANKSDVQSVRVVKSTLNTDINTLTQECTLEELSQQVIDADPELDIELFGKRVHDTTRIYLNSHNEPASAVTVKEQFYDASGELKEERDLQVAESNINSETPLSWTGKLIPKNECYKKFVFVNAFQLQHMDGLQYDFLYSMAKKLEDEQAMLFLGAGKKSNEPLILSRNGKQYRAFLEGRTQGEKYMLIMHLTNLELKPLTRDEGEKGE